MKIQIFNAKVLRQNNQKAEKLCGIETGQRLINENSKKPEKPKRNHSVPKAFIPNTEKKEFNIVFRDRLEELNNMKLDRNEKLVYYVLRDFVQHPSNCVMINKEVPSFKQLEPLVSLSERSIRDCLKTLEEKNLIKLVQSSHRKAIYINPEYYSTGKEINIDTLEMFNLIELDDEKIEQYLKECVSE